MKILHLATHINIGGIGRYVTNLAKALKKKGHSVIVASSGGELETVLSGQGIKHIYLDIRTKSELSPKIIKSFFELNTFLKKEKIDLIHAHTRVTQVLAALLSFVQMVPYVTTCHGFFKKRLGRRLFGCWGERSVAISKAVKNQLIHDFKVDEKKIALIHTGIEMDRFLRDVSREERAGSRRRWNLNESVVIGTIGRLSPVKGQGILIKAAEKIVRDFSDVKILLVGDGPDEVYLKRLSASLGLDKNVIFASSVNDATEALPAIDIFVLPSIKEGLGLSLIEAMAFGKACVASRVGGIESLIEDGVSGLLFRPGDSDDLVRTLKYILNNTDKTAAFKEEARKKVAGEFDIDKMTSRIEKMYGEVLGVRS